MLRLLLIVLTVPLIAFGVSEGIQARYSASIRAVLLAQVKNADPAKVARIDADFVCARRNDSVREFCAAEDRMNLLSATAVATGVTGLVMLGLIALAGHLTRHNRRLLLVVFRPGLYATAVVLTGLIAVHAVLAIAAIYYGESWLIDRVHIGIIVGIATGAIAGVVAMVRHVFTAVQKAQAFALGQSVSRDDAPELWAEIDAIAGRLEALRPRHLVLGLDTNFFVTEANVRTINDTLAGRTLYCSLPLTRILSRDEFAAIVGHELGHFKGEDTKFSEHFYPIYRGTVNSIMALSAAGGGSSVISLLPALGILGFFLDRFALSERNLSRTRELAADQAGVAVTSTRAMASALVKVHAYAPAWNEVMESALESARQGHSLDDVSRRFADAVREKAANEPRTSAAFDGISDAHLSHPTDSHPTLSVRIEALGYDVGAVATDALDVLPGSPASALLPRIESYEAEIARSFLAELTRRGVLEPPEAEPAPDEEEPSETGPTA
ncbi:MAG TPA: M48 family metallopeptidase [Vicinamibacterales bacterium]|jgi:Zn-dependent protease with chaperone function|nr:M48 family metallopeptidase [Vicinamibacterales bacterium]